MKKLFLLILALLLVLGFGTVSVAAATFNGEIDVAAKGKVNSGNTSSFDYGFSKMILNGKLGDDLTSTLVYKTDPVTSDLLVDEASITFTEDWGQLKLGYYGWNNNLNDIISIWTDDIKSAANISVTIKMTDNLNFGVDYAYTGNQYFPSGDPWITSNNWYSTYILGDYRNAYGADLGLVNETCGSDLLYYHYNDNCSAWGLNAWILLGDFKPFIQYRYYQDNLDIENFNLVNSIIGFTYESLNIPFYARAEVDLDSKGCFSYDGVHCAYDISRNTPWGVRIGYKFGNGAKLEAQYFYTGYNYRLGDFFGITQVPNSNEYSIKLISVF